MPAMIKARPLRRNGSAGSPKAAMPTIPVPAAAKIMPHRLEGQHARRRAEGRRSGSERRRYSLRCAFVTLLFHEPAAPMLRDHMFAVAPPILLA